AGARDQPVPHRHSLRGQDVSLLAVRVMKEGDPGRPVRVVLDRGNLRRHAVLVAPEVDDPVLLLVTPALVAGGYPAVGVPARPLGRGTGQRLLGRLSRYLAEVGDTGPTAARRVRLVLANGHLRPLCLEDLDGVPGSQGHRGPLHVR